MGVKERDLDLDDTGDGDLESNTARERVVGEGKRGMDGPGIVARAAFLASCSGGIV